MSKKTGWKAFNISMPPQLIPLYDFLQNELDWFLTDTVTRQQLEKINLKQHKGKVWIDFKNAFAARIQTWTIHNKAWHANILYENLRRELASKQEALLIYDELQKSSDFALVRENLVKNHKIYPTNGQLRNTQRMKARPELPYTAVFQLDYTVSNKQFFRMSGPNICQIKISKTDWINYEIILPSSLDHRLTGTIAKPRFMKRKKDGKYIGVCSYEYEISTTSGENILGVDIGKIKLFSAIVLKPDGSYSDEYIHSKRADVLKEKLPRLYEARNKLRAVIHRASVFNVETSRQAHRACELQFLNKKIVLLKAELARRVALEVVSLARKTDCVSIHVENLSWLDSKGGKWNHSEVLTAIELKAAEYGIKVERVNASYSSSTHPQTGERGEVKNRVVRFSSGREVDRDVLAAINLALRSKKKSRTTSLRKRHGQARARLTQSRRREIRNLVNSVKNNNGGTEMVVFSLGVVSSIVTAQSAFAVLPINSLLSRYNN